MSESNSTSIPYGYCECGCGQKTNIRTKTINRLGYIKGEPKRFILGHATRPWWRREREARLAESYAVDPETGCWLWQQSTSRDGYGRIGRNGRLHNAHCYFWERINGPVPDGLQLDHLCRNRACVNPDHLEPVTLVENVRRGNNAKLSMKEAREIRQLHAEQGLSGGELGRRYGVSKSTACRVLKGKLWRE